LTTKKHYYWIDLLRFLSALLVLLVHYRTNFFVEYGLLPDTQKNIFTQIFFFITRLGEEPVIVFFVLSGFLVGGKAIQRIVDNKAEPTPYFTDRFVRIILPLLASSLLVIAVDLITDAQIPFKDIAGSILSLQGIITSSAHNSPLWSLSYEMWFYILIGSLMLISVSKGKKLIFSYIIFTLSIYVFLKLQTLYLLILLMGTVSFLIASPKIKFLT